MFQPKDVGGWINKKEKQYLYISCLQETYFRLKDTCKLKVNGCKEILQGNGNFQKALIEILI